MTSWLTKVPTRAEWIAPLLLAFASLVLSGFITYTHTTQDTAVKAEHVQTQQANDDARLDRLENKLTDVDKKVDTLLEHLVK